MNKSYKTLGGQIFFFSSFVLMVPVNIENVPLQNILLKGAKLQLFIDNSHSYNKEYFYSTRTKNNFITRRFILSNATAVHPSSDYSTLLIMARIGVLSNQFHLYGNLKRGKVFYFY